MSRAISASRSCPPVKILSTLDRSSMASLSSGADFRFARSTPGAPGFSSSTLTSPMPSACPIARMSARVSANSMQRPAIFSWTLFGLAEPQPMYDSPFRVKRTTPSITHVPSVLLPMRCLPMSLDRSTPSTGNGMMTG